jgi:GNAT superfamily N-acetyltransferase
LKIRQPLSWFSDRLGGSTVLGAFGGGELIGIAGFALQHGQKRAHKGTLWGMYVRPAARSAGVGRRLVDAVCGLARRQVGLIQLTVVLDNEQARRLLREIGLPGVRHREARSKGSWSHYGQDLSE